MFNLVANERTVRNEDEQEWNDALTEHRAPRTWNVTRHPGCQISGHIMVDRAPGKFIIQAQSYGHDIAAHMTNLSHIVHHFSFGESDSRNHLEENWASMPKGFVKSLHPMDGNVYVTGELHQAYHHHLRVIPTEFDSNSKMMKWARDNARRVYRILQNSQLSTYRRHIVPGKIDFRILSLGRIFRTKYLKYSFALFMNIFKQRRSFHTISRLLLSPTSRYLVIGMLT